MAAVEVPVLDDADAEADDVTPQPAPPRARQPWGQRVEWRWVALFVALMALLQGLGGAWVYGTLRQGVVHNLEEGLLSGYRQFEQLVQQRAERLALATTALASDPEFRQAAGNHNAAVLADIMSSHSRRSEAAWAVYTDPTWQPLVATGVSASRAGMWLPPERMAALAVGPSGTASGTGLPQVVLLDGHPHQVVAVPVKAPRTLGWVLMGQSLDRSVLQQLAQLTDVQGSFLLQTSTGVQRLDGVLGVPSEALPQAAVSRSECGRELTWAGRPWHSCRFVLNEHGVAPGAATAGSLQLLLASPLDQALAPLERLQWWLVLLGVTGVALLWVAQATLVRRLLAPMASMRRAAERLGAGDSQTPVRLQDEERAGAQWQALAHSFEAMRQAVHQREQEFRRLAYWDALTGLPNRAQFVDAIRSHLHGGSQGQVSQPLAVLMLDLDRFKHVNDVLGHNLGDRLLGEASRRLAGCCTSGELVLARLSGDEFGVLMPGAQRDQAARFAHGLLRVLDEPLHLDDHTVDLSASLGIALAPQQAQDAEALLSLAEVAMYAAKRRQLGLLVYDAVLDNRSSASLSLLSELRQALERQELRLYVQPKVEMATGRVLGAEALVRWQHPQRGLVPPMQFIPFAEQTGFIRQITIWMLEAGVQALQEWQEEGLVLKLSINLSTRDLLDPDLISRVRHLLERHRVSAARLCLEITESAIMDDPQRAMQTLQKLHELGVKLSIDDFGTGYSSLAYLKRLPVSELKIDRSFVMNMARDLNDARIVQSTIGLAHNLGLSVVAEGVETEKTWVWLTRLGCDEGQGFGIGRPMPVEEWLGWVRRWRVPNVESVRIDTDFARL